MKKPNVIFILVDDMGYGDFSSFNGGITDTKALDSLVNEGITLSQCYASSPVCAPSRASILTGKYPQRTGVIDTLESRGLDRMKLDEVTMAEIFKSNGYNTGLIGKWHLGAIGEGYHPNNRGFDYFFGFKGGWTDYYNYNNLQRNGKKIDCEGRYITDVFSDDAVQYIKEHKADNFFLHLTYNAPHFPFQAPKKLVDKYQSTGKYTTRVSYIYAMIEAMDIGLSKILAEVKAQGIEEDTIIIFTSDNGPDFGGEKDDCGERFNCDLKGSKMLVYEGGIKVPAVIKWPGKLKEKFMTNEVISHMDWLPTLINMCNLNDENMPDIDGIDVSKAFSGERLENRKLFWQWNRYYPVLEGNAAMRDGDMKLIHPPIDAHLSLPRWEIAIDEDIKVHPNQYKELVDIEAPKLKVPNVVEKELYNLKIDPGEQNSITEYEKKTVKTMEQDMEEWFQAVERDRNS